MKLRFIITLCLVLLCAVGFAESQIKIPAATREIGAEAFYNTEATEVVLPDGITRIGSKAFANCADLAAINLPSTLNSISKDAFSGSGKVIATVEFGSRAQQFCIDNGVNYKCDPADVKVFNASASYDDELKQLVIDVRTPIGVEGLTIYDEKGNVAARAARNASSADYTRRNWYINYTFPSSVTNMSANWTVVPNAGLTQGDAVSFPVEYSTDQNTLVSDFALDDLATTIGQEVYAAVEINAETHYIIVRDAEGAVHYQSRDIWPQVEEGFFTFSLSFDKAGYYDLTVSSSADGKTWIPCDVHCGIDVYRPDEISQYISDFSFDYETITTGYPAYIEYEFAGDAPAYIAVFNGSAKLAQWNVGNEDNEYKVTLTQAGAYELTLKGSEDGTDWSDKGRTTAITVVDAPTIISGAGLGVWPLYIGKSDLQIEEIWTTPNAKYLALFNEAGEKLGQLDGSHTQLIEGNSILNWTGSFEVTTTEVGTKYFALRASADGKTWSEAAYLITETVERNKVEYVTSVSRSDGEEKVAEIEIDTVSAVSYLRMTDLDGNELALTITGKEDDEGGIRWKANHTFPSAGEYTVLVYGSADGKTWGDACVGVVDTQTYEPSSAGLPVYLNGFYKAHGTVVTARMYFEDPEKADASTVKSVGLYELNGTLLAKWEGDDLYVEEIFDVEDTVPAFNLFSYDFGKAGNFSFYAEIVLANGASKREYYQVTCVDDKDLKNYESLDDITTAFGDMIWSEAKITNEETLDPVLTEAMTPRKAPGSFYVLPVNTLPIDFCLMGDTDVTICGIRPGMTADEVKNAAGFHGATKVHTYGDTWEFECERFSWFYVHFESGIVDYISTFTYSEV